MRMFFRALILFAGLLFMSSCSGDTSVSHPVAKAGGTADVVRMEGGDWGYPTPFAHYPRGPGAYKSALIFDSLLERDEKGLIPWLATSWTLSEDRKTYTFRLRDGVTWQDGTPFTADDVAFSLMYMQKHPTPMALIYGMIESAQATGPLTVTVTVREPGVPCLYAIGLSRIIPKHIWKDVDRPKTFTTDRAVIGTGPYRLTRYSREHGTYRFEAFKGFWGPRQRVRALEYVPVSDRVLAFETRKIDIMRSPPDLLDRYEGKSSYGVLHCPAFWGYRLLMNFSRHEAFRDREVRKSIRYALNLDDMVEKIARGAAVPGMGGCLPPNHVMFNPNQPRYAYDPAKAKKILADRGYKPHDDRLRFELIVSSREDKEVRLGELIVQNLNALGMDVALVSLNQKTRDARVRDLAYDLAVLGHGGWGMDVDQYTYRFMENPGGSAAMYGYSGYVNEELSALFKAQHVAYDPAARKSLVQGIQTLLAGELPEIALYYGRDVVVYRKAAYDGWMNMFDHHAPTHSKLTWLERTEGAL